MRGMSAGPGDAVVWWERDETASSSAGMLASMAEGSFRMVAQGT